MSSKPKTLTTGDIVDKLRERGLSRRWAVRILNFILDEMAAALARGETVESPFGVLKKVAHAHKKKRGFFLDKITVIYKKPYTVALEVSTEGEKLIKKSSDVVQTLRADATRRTSPSLRIAVPLPPRTR